MRLNVRVAARNGVRPDIDAAVEMSLTSASEETGVFQEQTHIAPRR